MKITIKTFSIALGLITLLNSPTLATEDQDWQIKLRQKVHQRKFSVDNLFNEHHLPQTIEELSYAREAYNKGLRLLTFDKKGAEALPYLAYATQYMVPESLETLEWVGNGVYKEVPETIQTQVKQALANYKREFLKYNKEGSVYETFLDYWEKNEEKLRKKPSLWESVKSLVVGNNTPSSPNTKPMQSISSENFFDTSPEISPPRTREGTADDQVPLLPGDPHNGKLKKD